MSQVKLLYRLKTSLVMFEIMDLGIQVNDEKNHQKFYAIHRTYTLGHKQFYIQSNIP